MTVVSSYKNLYRNERRLRLFSNSKKNPKILRQWSVLTKILFIMFVLTYDETTGGFRNIIRIMQYILHVVLQ